MTETQLKGTVRRARMRDVQSIHDLIAPYARDGEMLPRTLNQIYEQLRDFQVFDDGERVVGVVALHFSWDNLAELRSLAVLKEATGQGIGGKLVKACLEEAKLFETRRVFTLTYRPSFFRRFGFRIVEREIFPQKIWKDCLHCIHFNNCKETAMLSEV